MAIETRIPAEELNIKNFSVEQERPAGTFDTATEVTQEDWRAMQSFSQSSGSVDHMLSLKILDPNIKFQLTDSWRRGLEAMLKQKSTTDFGSYENVGFLACLRVLKISADQEIIKKAVAAGVRSIKRSKNQALRSANKFWNFAYEAGSLKLFKPDAELGIDKRVIEGMKMELEEKRTSNLEEYVEFAARIKLLSVPIDCQPDQKTWKKMKRKLGEYRDADDWFNFIKLARSLKILAAQEIKIGDEGLELVMPERDQGIAASKIPESKKF